MFCSSSCDGEAAIAASGCATAGGSKTRRGVPDLRGVVPEAYEPVEDGHINEEQFRDFVFDNPVRLWSGMTPEFFEGTVIEGAALPSSSAR